jgi:hypothetical protein
MDTLRNHYEMIDLNPLVIERFKVKAPNFAGREEYHATWYQITDKIQYVPGLAKGSVKYYGCFNDLADGLQTHVYAPAGLDIRGRWTLGGSLPGEPAQPVELGLGIPKQGLYLREDVDMRCNIIMTSFVKKTLKKAHAMLVDRLLVKAQIVEVNSSNDKIEQWRKSAGSVYSDRGSLPGTPRQGYLAPSFTNLSSHSSPSLMSEPTFADNASIHTLQSQAPMRSPGYPSYQVDPNYRAYISHANSTNSTKHQEHLAGLGYGQPPMQSCQHPVELPLTAPQDPRIQIHPAELES